MGRGDDVLRGKISASLSLSESESNRPFFFVLLACAFCSSMSRLASSSFCFCSASIQASSSAFFFASSSFFFCSSYYFFKSSACFAFSSSSSFLLSSFLPAGLHFFINGLDFA